MAIVHLKIGGYNYTLACADGQEQDLLEISKVLDEKVASVKAGGGVSESLGLVMAGILLANENKELKKGSKKGDDSLDAQSLISKETLDQMTQTIEKATKKISGVSQIIERS